MYVYLKIYVLITIQNILCYGMISLKIWLGGTGTETNFKIERTASLL